MVFDRLVQVLVFGCGYERAADKDRSATTLRRRRDEWIAAGVMETLRLLVLAAYDRVIGLELDQLSADGCIAKRGAKTPIQAGGRWVVERTNSWTPTYPMTCWWTPCPARMPVIT